MGAKSPPSTVLWVLRPCVLEQILAGRRKSWLASGGLLGLPASLQGFGFSPVAPLVVTLLLAARCMPLDKA